MKVRLSSFYLNGHTLGFRRQTLIKDHHVQLYYATLLE